MTRWSRLNRLIFAASLCLQGAAVAADSGVQAEQTPESLKSRPRIALIIDDLGNGLSAGKRVVGLTGPVACAILPHTPYAKTIARQAHGAGKEVMLHLPLQPMAQVQPNAVGSIEINNTRSELVRILNADIRSVPHVVGVNSHMGSLLTQHPGHMRWLMVELKAKSIFFVDSFTTSSSVALKLADEYGVRAIRRDVFLDNVPTRENINREFIHLKELASANGYGVGIGHPYPETLDYLEEVLPQLKAEGIDLVTITTLIDH